MLIPVTQVNRCRGLATFNQRVQSLLDDGYHVTFRSSGCTSDMLWACLRHHNGNRVTVYAYMNENRLIQRTNHIVTHTGTLY